MIHRAMLGSIERFMGILIEHLAGAFPIWLAPVQIAILPITDRVMDYGTRVKNALETAGYRVELDRRQEKIGFKIREAQLQKVPIMIILGDREAQSNRLSLRTRKEGDRGTVTLDELLQRIAKATEDHLQELA